MWRMDITQSWLLAKKVSDGYLQQAVAFSMYDLSMISPEPAR